MGTGRRWFHRGQCRRKSGNCSVAARSSFQRCFYCSTSSLADGLTSPQPACLTMAVVISDQGWSTLKTTTVILECMQRNQEVLQACWNLKNCSQAGCGLAGFLHNCWYWVVRLAVMVARGWGGCRGLCQHSAIETFTDTDSGLMSTEMCSYKDMCVFQTSEFLKFVNNML